MGSCDWYTGVRFENWEYSQNTILVLFHIPALVCNNKDDDCDTIEASRGSLRHPPLVHTATKAVKTDKI